MKNSHTYIHLEICTLQTWNLELHKNIIDWWMISDWNWLLFACKMSTGGKQTHLLPLLLPSRLFLALMVWLCDCVRSLNNELKTWTFMLKHECQHLIEWLFRVSKMFSCIFMAGVKFKQQQLSVMFISLYVYMTGICRSFHLVTSYCLIFYRCHTCSWVSRMILSCLSV